MRILLLVASFLLCEQLIAQTAKISVSAADSSRQVRIIAMTSFVHDEVNNLEQFRATYYSIGDTRPKVFVTVAANVKDSLNTLLLIVPKDNELHKYIEKMHNAIGELSKDPFNRANVADDFFNLLGTNDIVYRVILEQINRKMISDTKQQLSKMITDVEGSVSRFVTNSLSPVNSRLTNIESYLFADSWSSLGAGIMVKGKQISVTFPEITLTPNIFDSASFNPSFTLSPFFISNYEQEFGVSVLAGAIYKNKFGLEFGSLKVNNEKWREIIIRIYSKLEFGAMIAIQYDDFRGIGFSYLNTFRKRKR